MVGWRSRKEKVDDDDPGTLTSGGRIEAQAQIHEAITVQLQEKQKGPVNIKFDSLLLLWKNRISSWKWQFADGIVRTCESARCLHQWFFRFL